MGVQTPTTSVQINPGNRMGIIASFGIIRNGDTWVTGLSVIEHVSISNAASGVTTGYTVSGGTVTFALSGNTTSPTTVMVIGFA
jgi:hypothetical protein